MKPEQAFGTVLRELQKALSQEALALKGDLDRTYISLLERGLRNPSLSSIISISRVLDIPASDMVKQVERLITKK